MAAASSSSPTGEAAARAVQSWYRRQRQALFAHRLLLWLHILHLQHQEESNAHPPMPATAAAAAPLPRAAPSSRGAVLSPASDAAVLAQLLDTVRGYEEHISGENYTRALLLEEFGETSAAMQAASAAARRRLRQQHAALRHVAVSTELAQRARDECVPPVVAAGAALDVLRALEEYLSPPHFAWWRSTLEVSDAPAASRAARHRARVHDGKTCARHIDAPKSVPLSASAARPVPLQTTEAEKREEDEEALDALVDRCGDDVGSDQEESAHRAAHASTQVVAVEKAIAFTGHRTDASSHPSDAQLESVSCVVRPVLGGAVGVHWRTTAAANATAAEALSQLSPLMCAVCELDGVLVSGDEQSGNGIRGDEEDALVACATCGTLVHDYCARTAEVDGGRHYFCCCHCRTV